MIDSTIREEFKKQVADAVREGLYLVIPNQKKTHQYYNWPRLSYFKNGIPNLSENILSSGPLDYKSLFLDNEPIIPKNDIPSFQKLLSLVYSNSDLLNKILPGMNPYIEENDIARSINHHLILRIPVQIIDRYIHINDTMEFNYEKFELIYEPLANSIFLENLIVDICVPILFLKFDFENIKISENVSIERMDDSFHFARSSLLSYSREIPPAVLSAATHCLVFRNKTIPNTNYLNLVSFISEIESYPLEDINKFFASLRLVTGVNSGYSQLLFRPINWAIHYRGNLMPLEGTSIKAYPVLYENYYWLKDNIQELNLLNTKEIGKIFTKLMEIKESEIHIAANRLNLCYLRESEEDNILDAIIGLETLISDDNLSEMTYKLSIRLGALSMISKPEGKNPFQVFKEIKKIYSYRSAIVHGSSDKNKKKKEKSFSDNPELSISSNAVEYLRMALIVLIENPKYRKSEKIDEFLLSYKPELTD